MFGKFVYDNGLTNSKELKIETLAGIKNLELFLGEDGKVKEIKVDMGEPIIEPEEIPVILDEDSLEEVKVKIDKEVFILTPVSMGNPHAVAVVDDVDNFDVEKYGKILEVDKHFPKRANIEFVQILDRHTIKMRVWERGSGETLACGTGACAVCVACTLNGLVDRDEEITVKLLGGDLKIRWDEHVFMTGPARTVFRGTLHQ